jgi:hypothetical protein
MSICVSISSPKNHYYILVLYNYTNKKHDPNHNHMRIVDPSDGKETHYPSNTNHNYSYTMNAHETTVSHPSSTSAVRANVQDCYLNSPLQHIMSASDFQHRVDQSVEQHQMHDTLNTMGEAAQYGHLMYASERTFHAQDVPQGQTKEEWEQAKFDAFNETLTCRTGNRHKMGCDIMTASDMGGNNAFAQTMLPVVHAMTRETRSGSHAAEQALLIARHDMSQYGRRNDIRQNSSEFRKYQNGSLAWGNGCAHHREAFADAMPLHRIRGL